MRALLKEVLNKTIPSQEEREKVIGFSEKVLSELKKLDWDAEVEGSLAKDTWISGNHDVDIFLFFDLTVPWDVLEKEGLQIGAKVVKELGGKPEKAFAEHPYIRTDIEGIHLDLVPCYKLQTFERIRSAVDRTPFHTQYIKANLTEDQRGEVRLLKQFAKGIEVYSAKEKVRGFSGYLCELLILHFGTFEKLLKSVKNWEYGMVIDPEKLHEEHGDLKTKFSKQAMIVIDPTDKNRNVAAALTDDNFNRFIFAVKQFLKNPKREFFFPKPVKPLSASKMNSTLKKHGGLLIVKFKPPEVVEDILYSQLKRSLKSLAKQLKMEDFTVLDSAVYSNEYTYFFLELETLELPKIKKLAGPPSNASKENQDAFTKKYKKSKPWIEDGRWWVEVSRKKTKIADILVDLFKKAETLGLGKYVIQSLDKNYEIIQTHELTDNYEGEFAQYLTKFLTKKYPWEN